MKHNYRLIIFFLFVFSPFFSLFTYINIPTSSENSDLTLNLSNGGISKYHINQSVTYQLEMNFTLTHTKVDDQNYYLNIARFYSRNTNTSLTPPYQISEIKYNNTSGFDNHQWNYHDKFNNTYDCFDVTMTTLGTTQITYSMKYEIVINEIYFDTISDSDIGVYDTSENIFDLYCNNSEEYYLKTDPDLINAANNEAGIIAGDNPIEKANKIYNFVINRLVYNDSLPSQEMGASWAYDNRQGDCSEFSSLMVTLLRIQNIPARKVVGLVVSNNPLLRPKVGDKFTFDQNYQGSTQTATSTNPFLGHAWVEYYVPNIGWIVCDPTWGDGGGDYFNHNDYFHLSSTVGAWIFFPPSLNYSEYPFMPAPAYSNSPSPDPTAFNYDLEAKFTVIDTNLLPLSDEFPWLLIIIIIIGIIAFIAIIIIISRRNR